MSMYSGNLPFHIYSSINEEEEENFPVDEDGLEETPEGILDKMKESLPGGRDNYGPNSDSYYLYGFYHGLLDRMSDDYLYRRSNIVDLVEYYKEEYEMGYEDGYYGGYDDE